ncbi:hypothetical protein EUU22_20120 [Ciceribacter ferrooxidans]|uniref:Transmembrane protein n=1 Tax=Ciceribacter ferrooxidans TaxID=2509717 RepID=A0A4V1RN35_9HYPH|nr:hypothetical protein EUU22_20120 [Ciceribacter ferrooxidans]
MEMVVMGAGWLGVVVWVGLVGCVVCLGMVLRVWLGEIENSVVFQALGKFFKKMGRGLLTCLRG